MNRQAFIFGRPVEGEFFTDREAEAKRLSENFKSGVSTFLLSPRRWGKTSLIKKVMTQVQSDDLKVVFVDVFKCKSPIEFAESVASAVLSQTATKADEFLENAKNFLDRINLGINLSPDPANSLDVKFGLSDARFDVSNALSLPEKIAQKKKIKLLICIDEFQQIGEFSDTISFQKELRTIWQHQNNVTYCLFGSKKHMMENLFDTPEKAFFKFGDIIYLKTIPLSYWIKYVHERFDAAKKKITDEQIQTICETVQFHSSYVQQLCWYVYLSSSDIVTKEDIDYGIEELIYQNTALFESWTENLAAYQMRLLRAVADGHHDGLSSAEVMKKYRLMSSATVVSAKKSLLDKNLLYTNDGKLYLTDPVMGMWLKR